MATDERYNARRRARRAAARIEKRMQSMSGQAYEEAAAQLKTLKDVIAKSYINKETKTYDMTVKQLQRKTWAGRQYRNEINKEILHKSAEKNARINKQVESYFKSAAKGKDKDLPLTPEQMLASAEQKFLYNRTVNLWQGTDPSKINETIVQKMKGVTLESGRKVENLKDAMNFLKEKYRGEYPTYENLNKFVEAETEHIKGSPNFVPGSYTNSEWRSFGANI